MVVRNCHRPSSFEDFIVATGVARLRGIWSGMKTRCTNQKRKDYYQYGGSGITVCDEWSGRDGFKNFYDWAMSHGYEDGLSIDRIDGSNGYSPDNCRWATISQQNRNKSTNHLLEYNGEVKTLIEWAEIAGVRKDTFRRRIVNNGWTLEEAINTPNLRGKAKIHHRNWRQ